MQLRPIAHSRDGLHIHESSGLSGAANFFSAGGDSLSAMQVIVRLRAAGIHAGVTRLYEAPMLAGFIQLVAAPLN